MIKIVKTLCFLLLYLLTNHSYAVFEDKKRQDMLILGFASAPNSLDPHQRYVSPNIALLRHLYNSLFYYESNGVLTNDLAEKYTMISDKVWNIKIKENITFHDGSKLDIDDVIYTFDRISNPSLALEYKNHLRSIKKYNKVDNYTIKITTYSPYPDLINDLVDVPIMKKEKHFKTSEEINLKKYSNGTGPYRLISIDKKLNFLLQRNEQYFNTKKKGQWEYVAIIASKNKKELIQDFIEGKIDVIEKVTPEEVKIIKQKGNYRFISSTGNRLIYLFLDQFRQQSPYIKGRNDENIVNPLLDRNVRAAVSIAIDREKICNEILNNTGIPTLQYVRKSSFEYDKTIGVNEYNPQLAKQLLNASGFSNGFKITLHGPNDRYIKDKIVLETIAAMLREVNIEASVETMSKSYYFDKANVGYYSAGLIGWATNTGKLLHMIDPILSTYRVGSNTGFNTSRYSNKEFDYYVGLAKKSFNMSDSEKYAKFAADIARKDYAIIPLYFEKSLWAMQKNIKMSPQNDLDTFATRLKKIE